MPILLLIRHATNDFVKTGRLPGQGPNLHLNAEGRGQAAALARFVASRPIEAVYASHLERAIETAWAIAGPRDLPVRIRPTLADTDAGDYTGKLIRELAEGETTKETWKAIVERPREGRFPNGESPLDMQRRVIAELERIVAAHADPEMPPTPATPTPEGAPKTEPPPPRVVAVVMHNSTVQAALAHFLGMPFENYERLAASPASLSTVMVTPKRAVVVGVNWTA